MMKLAFYGKGGIGKTTIACNVSAILAQRGYKVLHIGCDPKTDSTRLLTEKRIPSVLQQMARQDIDINFSDIIFQGKVEGLYCLEAGGPKAGTGCAGAGITAMHELLEEMGVFERNWDVIIYDVLGDVVCGGFSVPMKSEYVDKVYIVTSSEYMSIFAANNILQAVEGFSDERKQLFGGLIWNHCGSDWDRRIGKSFSELTQTEILMFLDEWEELQKNDYARTLVVQNTQNRLLKSQFEELTDRILRKEQETKRKTVCAPCSIEQLEAWRESVARLR